MILLIHLLEHLGLPSGAAIAVVIGARKAVKGAAGRTGARQDRGQGHPRDYR
jgi:hypothetical protein